MLLGEDFNLGVLTGAILPNETAAFQPNAAGARYVGCLRARENTLIRVSEDCSDVPSVQRDKSLSVISTIGCTSQGTSYEVLVRVADACEIA